MTHLVIDEAEVFEMGVDLSIDYGFRVRMRHDLAVIPKLVLKLGCEKSSRVVGRLVKSE